MMKNVIKASFAISVMLLVSNAAEAQSACPAGRTASGQCVNPRVANTAKALGLLLTYDANRYIPPLPPTREWGNDDPLRRADTKQPQFGPNGPAGISGGASQNFVYGRWN